jgi:microcystin degradation protein MlrC
MRVALIHIGQETNDFNPVPTRLLDYESFGIFEGPKILEEFQNIGQIGGHLKAVADSGLSVETVPIIRAWATAGGRITSDAFEFFQGKIEAGLRAAGQIDGLALQLHGACAAEGIDDVEGEQLALCRNILGPRIPIVLGLDHHANVTRRLVELSTAIVGHRTQPHDPFDTGVIGTALLLRIVQGQVKPVMAWRKIPLVTHQEQFLTDRGPMKTWFDHARATEAADKRVLQVAPFPMQPWLDVAEGGWATVVVTDNDPALAERLADESAGLVWSLREALMERDAVPVDEAVRRAEAAPKGVVVLSDTGDTVFGGAGGDSNLILESMLRQGTTSPTLMPMIAPESVATLVAAGQGATVTLPLGGNAAPEFFTPLQVTGTVRAIGGGVIPTPGMHQRQVDMGRSVVFQVGPVTLVISELRGVAGNTPVMYHAFGIDPRDYKIAVLKTASNFQHFAPITSQLIRVDTRGPGQSDVAGLPWRRLPRPIHPLDPMADWREQTSPSKQEEHAR